MDIGEIPETDSLVGVVSPQEHQHVKTTLDRWLKALSVLMIVAGAGLALSALPMDAIRDRVEMMVQSAGPWGPVIYGATYIIFTVAFIPGSILTLIGGAIFGLFWGSIIVSLSATTPLSVFARSSQRANSSRASRLNHRVSS